jgi:hypothetical protein
MSGATSVVAAPFLRRHFWFILAVVAGTALRLITIATYRPALMFFGDSYAHLIHAQRVTPPNDRGYLYSGLLRIIAVFGDLQLVVVLQHLAGVGLAMALYVVLLRRSAPPWLATLAALPLLLDAFWIQLEHNILTETLFTVLLTSAILVVTRRDPGIGTAVAAGLLLAGAAMTRTVALPAIVLVGGYLLLRRVGWQRVVAFGIAAAIPLTGYALWFQSTYGAFGLSDSSNRFMYGRLATFADCTGLDLTSEEAKLCDNSDPSLRPNGDFYIWASDSPVNSLQGSNAQREEVLASFNAKVLRNQPLTYVRTVATDLGHYFAPGRFSTRVDSDPLPWYFPSSVRGATKNSSIAHVAIDGSPTPPSLDSGGADLLRAYQNVVFTQGPLLLLGCVLGFGAGWLRRGRPDRWDGPLAAAVALMIVAIPSITVLFGYRYAMPMIPLASFAGALGGLALLQRRAERLESAARADDSDGTPTDAAAFAATAAAPGGARGRRRRQRFGLTPAQRGAVVAAVLAGIAIALHTVSPLDPAKGFEQYVFQRAEHGVLGPPLGEPVAVNGVPNASRQQYTSGSIVSTPTRAAIVPPRYDDAIAEAGGFRTLGLPAANEQRSPFKTTARLLRFDKGAIFWTRLGGTRTVSGTIYEAWNLSSVRNKLKEPTGEARRTRDGTLVQTFTGGSITVSRDGSVSVDIGSD